MLYILTSPSGAGKTTIVNRLLETGEFVRPITHTTRPPREGEVDGVHYHFVSRAQFEELLAQGAMLEHANVYGKLYGTSRAAVQSLQEAHPERHILLIVDVQGAAAIKQQLPCVTIFIAPPTLQELERRLRGRAQDDEAAIRRRLDEASHEMSHIGMFDHVVVNDDLEQAIAEIHALVRGAPALRQP